MAHVATAPEGEVGNVARWIVKAESVVEDADEDEIDGSRWD